MRLPVVGFSRVHKPTSWFALHFIHERGAYLVLEHKDNKPLPIYRNIKCLAGFYVKPQHINLFSTTRCIISFLYIKPQLKTILARLYLVVLYRFSTSNHNAAHSVSGSPPVVLYRFSTSNHNLFNSCSMRSAVVLYRFSTSNHNSTLLACSQPYVVLYTPVRDKKVS